MTAASPAAPQMTPVFTLTVTLAPAQEQGIVDGLRRRFLPITGGRVAGPRLTGEVLAGGGDWQVIHPDGLSEINTRYAVRANDGTVIEVRNPGVRFATPDVTARMAAGEVIAPDLYYFRTAPRFTVPAGPHEWLRRTLFVGRGVRMPDHVEIEVFAVD